VEFDLFYLAGKTVKYINRTAKKEKKQGTLIVFSQGL
jgi:hypothetical protein